MPDQGYPQEGDLVIATVTKIQYHSIFCDLDEYKNKSAMIHISEVAPGRIRNIHDYLKEGKSVVAKVLRVDDKKGHIDLSIRRVTDQQRKHKASQRKQSKLVENILAQVAEQLKQEPNKLQAQLQQTLGEQEIYEAFVAVVEEETSFEELGVDKKTAQALTAFVQDRIKPQRVTIKGVFMINSYAADGVARIRAAFSELPKDVQARYKGAGVYSTHITAKNYKDAEETLKIVDERVRSALKEDATITFSRTDKK